MKFISIAVLTLFFSSQIFAGQPKATLCSAKAIQVGAYLTVLADPEVSLLNPTVKLTDFFGGGEEEEDYGIEEWMIQYQDNAPLTIKFAVDGSNCRFQSATAAGL